MDPAYSENSNGWLEHWIGHAYNTDTSKWNWTNGAQSEEVGSISEGLTFAEATANNESADVPLEKVLNKALKFVSQFCVTSIILQQNL